LKVYRYWVRGSVDVPVGGQVWNVVCFGSSNESMEEASENAVASGERIKNAIMEGRELGGYSYTDRPLREELLREVHQEGELAAVITRNGYGAQVLCTANVMFIDIDVIRDDFRLSGPGFFARLLKLKYRPKPDPVEKRPEVLEGIQARAREHDLGMRVYRTTLGYRCLVTSETFDPAADDTLGLLRDFGSDELYVKMCRAQDCFRARLTPKPHRVRLYKPGHRYPWIDDSRRRMFERWLRAYEERSQGFSACRYKDHFGRLKVARGVQEIVDIHDSIACSGDHLA
jgi:hypothetical protein